ncbi:RPAP1-like protein [Aspergillus ambiguus]|uniref:RPAP1 family protein n=1 Tax=Aspergillus ambiguus TaxID=176160 RepID=UPI003CCDB021
MAFRGERFVLDLDSDDDLPEQSSSDPPPLAVPGMIGEIQERSPTTVPAPPKPPTTGFPAHRRRNRPSAFKQRRDASAAAPAAASSPAPGLAAEKAAIAEENRRHLQSMSAAQLQQEREELMATMDSSLLERFLRRARIDADEHPPSSEPAASSHREPSPPPPTPAPKPDTTTTTTTTTSTNDDLPPSKLPEDLHPAAEALPAGLHFPTPPNSTNNPMPNLDPSSPTFLSDLQTHYFPNISHDSATLTWLQPPPSDPDAPDASSAYHPASTAEAVHPAHLRFTLLGTVLSPSTSLALPTSLGLHHHGNDPHAAGYTIPELAILSRSSFPAQRCIAWQVLGRILFRLGKGQFGERGSTLVEGLWGVIEKENVVAGMLAEADGDQSISRHRAHRDSQTQSSGGASGASMKGAVGKHASAAAWAVEGVWLWQTGGGGDRGILKEGAVRSQ